MDNKKRILLIEDDADTRNLYSDLLKTKGYEVVTAVDGVEGHIKANEGSYGLVLLDIMMPNEDGLEVLSTLKNENSKLKIAIFTNLSSANLLDEARRKGADEFIVKSDMDPGKFLEKVASLIN